MGEFKIHSFFSFNKLMRAIVKSYVSKKLNSQLDGTPNPSPTSRMGDRRESWDEWDMW